MGANKAVSPLLISDFPREKNRYVPYKQDPGSYKKRCPQIRASRYLEMSVFFTYGPGVQVGWQGQAGSSNGHFGVQVGIGVGVKVFVGIGVLVSGGIGVQLGIVVFVFVGTGTVFVSDGVMVGTSVSVVVGAMVGVQVSVGVKLGSSVAVGVGGSDVADAGGGGIGVQVVDGVGSRRSWQPLAKSMITPKSLLSTPVSGPPPPQSELKSMDQLFELPALNGNEPPVQLVGELSSVAPPTPSR